MSWNYRVMVHQMGFQNIVGIHEVYYDDDDKVTGWTENPVQAMSVMVDENSDNLYWVMEEMAKALTKPHLDYETGKEME